MATGRRPFTGDTSVSIISSIVKDTPQSVTTLNEALPREIGRIVGRALHKEPDRRYQTAKDLRNDLDELKSSLDSGDLAATDPAHAIGSTRRRLRVWQWSAIGASAITLAMLAVLLWPRETEPGAPASVPLPRMVRLTNTGNARMPVISPDGKYVAYVKREGDRQSIWIRQIASASEQRIVEPTWGIGGLSIAPDGTVVDFVKRRSPTDVTDELWRVPFLGGPPRKIVESIESAVGWSLDGKRMAYVTVSREPREYRLVVADADGSHARIVATRKPPLTFTSMTGPSPPDVRPVWLPDGTGIAVAGIDPGRTSRRTSGRSSRHRHR